MTGTTVVLDLVEHGGGIRIEWGWREVPGRSNRTSGESGKDGAEGAVVPNSLR